MPVTIRWLIDQVRTLKMEEIRVLIALIEHKSIRTRDLPSIATAYGFTLIGSVRSLSKFSVWRVVEPSFSLPRNLIRIVYRAPFPHSFTLTISGSRNERDILMGTLRTHLRKFEELMDAFDRVPIYNKRSLWGVLKAYYEKAPNNEVEPLINLYIELSNDQKNWLAWVFLGVWTAYYLSYVKRNAYFVNKYWPRLLPRLAKPELPRFNEIVNFVLAAENELFLEEVYTNEYCQKVVDKLKNLGQQKK